MDAGIILPVSVHYGTGTHFVTLIDMKKKDYYRITIDVTTEPDGTDRCSDIEHHLYMVEKELFPYTVRKEKIEYKVEKLRPSVTMEKYHEPFDWDRFRAETARDVLAGMMGHERIRYDDSLHECQVKTAIEYADELIKQLKEK